jgi:aspartyl-tRNA(Asn)/glutamyl-tRNA(Gln) amidotransferase subunit B
MALRAILRAIGASEADMEKGQLRAEANVSVRRAGSTGLGTKTELKNINSFRALQRAVEHEIRRQVEVLEAGGAVTQETRGWSEAEQRTFPQRSKEQADDYRYFPEPDLPPLELDPAWVERVRAALPELPAARRRRLVEVHGITAYDAEQLTKESATADLFEATVAAGAPAKPAANWIVNHQPGLEAGPLAELVRLVHDGTINRDQGLQVQEESAASGRAPGEVVRDRGLAQVSDEAALAEIADRAIAEHAKAAADFRAGKEGAIGPLIGAVVRASGGRANPGRAREVLLGRLRSC